MSMARVLLFAALIAAIVASGCAGPNTTSSPPFEINSGPPPNGTTGIAYPGFTFIASNAVAPVTWTESGPMPPGLSLNSAGNLQGTPVTAGTYSFTVNASDSSVPARAATTLVSLQISDSPIVISQSPQPTSGTATYPYVDFTFRVTSGGSPPFTWAITAGALPPGLTLGNDGSLSGLPTKNGSFSFTVTATDSAQAPQNQSAPFAIVVNSPTTPVVNTTPPPPSGSVAFPYAVYEFTATGGLAPYTWVVGTGAAPAGLTLAPDGTLSGTPTTAGTFMFTVTATDSAQPPVAESQSFNITIGPLRHTGAWAFQQAAARRVDLVMMSDSNQLHFNAANGDVGLYGGGWNGGWQYAFWKNAGLYATSVNPAGENDNQGVNIGFYSFYLVGSAPTTGAAGKAEQYCPAGALPFWYYEYVADTTLYSVAGQGMAAGGPWNLQNPLRGWFATGTFASGTGVFQPYVRREDSGVYTTYGAAPSAISTNDGTGGNLVLTPLDLPANTVANGGSIDIGWRPRLQGSQTPGPFVHYYTRVEDPTVTAGGSAHTMIAAGGKGLYDFATYLNAAPDLELWMILNEARRLQLEQGLAPIVVMIVNSGVNDRNYTSAEVPSLGPTGGDGTGNSAASYIDNLTAIVSRIERLYGQYWPLSELSWVVMPSHPFSSPEDTHLTAYRAAVNAWAQGMPQASSVDIGQLTTYDYMNAHGWYDPGGNAHLSQIGYDQIGLLAYQNLLSHP
jgi:putative Ig domain-containing protein